MSISLFVAMTVRAAAVTVSLFVVSLAVMAIRTAIRLDLEGVSLNDVFDLLVPGWFVVVTGVNVVQVALGVVTVTVFLLAVIDVIVIVLHAPIKIVMGGVLYKTESIQ